jgi:hypothetical protein
LLGTAGTIPLERDEFRMSHHRALAYCLSMISAQTRSAFVARENRCPLFRIMLQRRTCAGGAPGSDGRVRLSALCSVLRVNAPRFVLLQRFKQPCGHASALPRRVAPEGCMKPKPSSIDEGAGKAGCRSHPWPPCVKNARGRNHRYEPDSPAFPARWFYGLYALSPVSRACLPPSPA